MLEDKNTFDFMQEKFKSLNLLFLKTFLVSYENNKGLVPKTGPLPQNRKLWSRPSSSMERNGMFNIHTPNFNTRLIYPMFFFCFLYGWWGHATYGMYKAKY
jgi:hypothetical protein